MREDNFENGKGDVCMSAREMADQILDRMDETQLMSFVALFGMLNNASSQTNQNENGYVEHVKKAAEKKNVQGVRIGIAKGKVQLPEDFDEQFDMLDREIAELFYGGAV